MLVSGRTQVAYAVVSENHKDWKRVMPLLLLSGDVKWKLVALILGMALIVQLAELTWIRRIDDWRPFGGALILRGLGVFLTGSDLMAPDLNLALAASLNILPLSVAIAA